jgi:hypothetical protein
VIDSLGHRISLDDRDLRLGSGLLIAVAASRAALHCDVGIPCPLRALTGIPCPLCGMTTSVEATVRLHVGRALEANPAGLAAVVVALLLLVVRPAHVRVPAALPLVLLAGLWLFELHRFSVLF